MAELKVIATYGICNWGGVEIGRYDYETVTYRYNFGEPEGWHLTSCKGNGAWFRTYKGDKIKFDECSRVG